MENIIREHNKRDNVVFKFFKEASEESNNIIVKDKNGNDFISARVQMIINFSLIDMLANYWYEYRGASGKTNEKSKIWYETFCASDRNKEFKDLWKEISSERIYILRNSLVHFFGLGENGDDISVSLCQNNFSEEMRKKQESHYFLYYGKKTLIIRPRDFSKLVREGAILMLDDWRSIISESQSNLIKARGHIDGIERVWLKIQREGAVRDMLE